MRAFVFAALMLAACAQTTGAGGSQSQPASELTQRIRADLTRLDSELRAPGVVAASFGETADLGGGLTVRPIEVLEDSRCAANVQCVWEGRLRLRAMISGSEREIILGQPLTTPQGAVVLVVAKPGAWADWPTSEIPRPAYRFGFRRG